MPIDKDELFDMMERKNYRDNYVKVLDDIYKKHYYVGIETNIFEKLFMDFLNMNINYDEFKNIKREVKFLTENFMSIEIPIIESYFIRLLSVSHGADIILENNIDSSFMGINAKGIQKIFEKASNEQILFMLNRGLDIEQEGLEIINALDDNPYASYEVLEKYLPDSYEREYNVINYLHDLKPEIVSYDERVYIRNNATPVFFQRNTLGKLSYGALKLLMDICIDPNILRFKKEYFKDIEQNMLDYAISEINPDILRLALSSGMNPNAPRSEKQITKANMAKYPIFDSLVDPKLFSIMAEYGADLNLFDKGDPIPIKILTKSSYNSSAYLAILSKYSDPNIVYPDGESLVEKICKNVYNANIMRKYFMELKPDVYALDDDGKRIMNYCYDLQPDFFLRYEFEKTGDILEKDRRIMDLVEYGLAHKVLDLRTYKNEGEFLIFKLLRNRINSKNTYGFLYERGLAVNVRNSEGVSAYAYAIQQRNQPFVEMMNNIYKR